MTFGFADITRATLAFLVERLALSALPLPAELARATGSWKGGEIEIETRAFQGEVVRYARFAVVTGESIEIGNVLCLPAAAHSLPILGADLVGVRAGSGMVAADLSPTLPAGVERDVQLSDLAARRGRRETLPPGGDLPEWCARWFSPYYLYTRGTVEELQGIEGVFHNFAESFVTLAHRSVARPELASAVDSAQQGYLQAHLTDDKGLNLLGAMFGKEWSARYVREVLFPLSG